jgi:uncharacterized protein with beta-barrel porin domain
MPRRAAVLAMVGGLCAAVSAHATDFSVTISSDSGTGSLREAITDSNTDAESSDTITFSLPTTPTTATITLSSDLDAVTSDTLSFVAPAAPTLTINGGGKIIFQNASTSHVVTFDLDITYSSGKFLFTEESSGTINGTLKGKSITLTKSGTGATLLAGTISLDTASTVDIDAGTFTVNGTLSGPGTLAVAAPATLQMSGTVSAKDVTVSGAIAVNPAGHLTATNALLVAADASLVDSGTVNVTNALTNHGTLTANGALTAGSLTIASDGVLTGTAGTMTAPVSVAGHVAPSTSAGALTINGPVTFQSTSTYDVDIGSTNSDSLAVNGAVTIQPGARLALVANPDSITSTVKTVLTASGGLSGQFLATDYAFLQEDLNYQPTSLIVTLTSTGQSFTPFATTRNQFAAAQVLDAALPTATGDLQTVFDSLKTAQAGEIAPMLDAIGGESLTAFATARQILAERTGRALHRRVRDGSGEGRAFYLPPREEPDVAAAPDTASEDEAAEPEPPARPRVRPGAWLDGIGLYSELDGHHGEADVDTLLYGGTLGGDAWIADHFVLGLAAGYVRSDIDLDGRDTDGYGDTVQGALYAGFVDPRGYLSAYGRYAYTFESSTRQIQSSTLDRDAHASFDAQDYGVGGELGVTVLSYRGFALQPVAGVDWLRMDEDSYTEDGAGDLNLVVHPDALESTTGRFGARMFGRLEMGTTGTLVPELRVFYQHLWGDRERALDARLEGAPGLGSIGVRGAEMPSENLLLGLGWGVHVGEYLTVSFDYDAVLGSDRVDHQGTVAARVLF